MSAPDINITVTEAAPINIQITETGLPGVGVPTGGEPGQVVTKTEDGTEWQTPSAASGTVQSVNDITPDDDGNVTLPLPFVASGEDIDMAGNSIKNLPANPTDTDDAVSAGFVHTNYRSVSEDVDMQGSERVVNMVDPQDAQDGATKSYVDVTVGQEATRAENAEASLQQEIDTKLPTSGGQMGGQIDMQNSTIVNLGEPQNAEDAATKNYVDTHAGGGGGTIQEVLDAGDVSRDDQSLQIGDGSTTHQYLLLSPGQALAHYDDGNGVTADTGINGLDIQLDYVDVNNAVDNHVSITMVEDENTGSITLKLPNQSGTLARLEDVPPLSQVVYNVNGVTSDGAGNVTVPAGQIPYSSDQSDTYDTNVEAKLAGIDQLTKNGVVSAVNGMGDGGGGVIIHMSDIVREGVDENIDMSGYQVVNMTDPTNPQDAATKAYVDAAIAAAIAAL